jgi:2-dehydropantoate 2-reductase
MRIAVIGAGGVGGYFGARLAAAGEDVTFIQRGAHLEAMRAAGLGVTSPLGDVTLRQVRAQGDAEGVGPVEVVLVTVKSNHTDEAGALASAMLGPETAVISLQNGVENEARLAAIVGQKHVVGGVAYMLSVIEAPGRIRHSGKMARIVFGELDGRATRRCQAFRDACARAHIDVELSGEIEGKLWAKFAVLCPHTGMTALTRLPIGPLREDPECRAVLERGVGEVIAVAEARGVTLPEELRAEPMAFFNRVPAEMTSSMHHDLIRGKPLELEWLSGAVVRLGREAGVATPVNQFLYACLKPHAAGRHPMAADGVRTHGLV